MLFELRDTIPEVSPSWIEARDAFLAGHSRKAWALATNLRGGNALRLANDFILNVEIARASSAHRTYMALARGAMRAFPEDPIVRLYHARVLLTRGRYTEGLEFLLGCESTLGRSHRALWTTELANMYGAAGFDASCRKWLAAARNESGIDAPLALYTQSCACEGMQQWELAIELAAKCVAAAPDWTRARAYLANCLLARGRVEEAERELAEAVRRGHEEALVDMSRAMLAMSLGRFDEARQALEAVLRDWPQAEFLHWVRRTLCILLVELGDLEAARQLVAGHEQRYALPEIPEVASGSHSYLPLPLVAQNKNQCVPTSVAMAAFPQGYRLDPDVMFREMHGREGTPLWRMRSWAEEHGLSVIPIRLEKEAIVSILAHGVPLIGALEGPFNSHVDVICGYNDSLQTLYVRDPAHWAPAAWPWELGLARYAMHGGVYAVIDQGRTEVLAAANSVRAEHCAALLELSQAVAQGEIAKAEYAYTCIPDEVDAATLRDGYAVNVVISPLKFRERMRAISEDENAKLLPRFRALMSLGSDDARDLLDKLLETEKSQRLGVGMRRYLTLQKQMADGHWRQALASVERLLLSGGGISHFWELKSDILAELGDHEASRDALGKAIELEPLRISLREKALHQSAHRMTLAEYLEEFDSLLARDPDDKRLLWARADALMEGPDGREYERAALEASRWFPRAPAVYLGLLNWYQAQGRRDLTDAMLKLARERLPDVFGDSSEAVPQETSGATEGDDAKALPDDKDEFLKLLWAVNDARRPAAVQRVLDMQQSGQLHWYEAARLAACRLLIPDRPDMKTANPDAILPALPPGAAHWYARVLCDALTDHAPSLKIALDVNEWLDRVVPAIRSYPELWFQRVLLLEHGKQMERALDELRRLLELYPAYSSALYRMGIVKYRQEDFSSACRYLDQALEVNPGLMGAMDALVTIHETMGNRKEALRYVRMLRRKLPYSLNYLRDEVAAVAELESANAAEAILAEHAVDFPADRLA
ncbi:MAG: tetratricopeptide repeat protein, partial [Planctomycetales bacterium]|nr:tetratricopeptide repeat protein [Planctomycetales bacterium]